jgi:dTDP-4-dehydrorhamnose reductase
VTGAGGFIGSHLLRSATACAPGWQVIPWTRDQLDLSDLRAVAKAFSMAPPAAVVHAAALSRAPDCQADPARAELLNVELTRLLGQLAGDIPLVFISTDLVFDGTRGHYVETDPVNPLSCYAETKARAEGHVLACPRHAVVRLALSTGISPTGDRSFTEVLRRRWDAGETLPFFRDEFRSPLPASSAARAIWELLLSGQPGLFHLGGSERLSRWEIGQLVAKRWSIPAHLLRESSLAEHGGARRPADCSMNCGKLQGVLSFRLPGLRQWTREHPAEPL